MVLKLQKSICIWNPSNVMIREEMAYNRNAKHPLDQWHREWNRENHTHRKKIHKASQGID